MCLAELICVLIPACLVAVRCVPSAAHDADDGPRGHLERAVVQQAAVPETLYQPLGFDYNVTEARSQRDRDAVHRCISRQRPRFIPELVYAPYSGLTLLLLPLGGPCYPFFLLRDGFLQRLALLRGRL